ncbi:phage holin, LLH family [Limosilactobacillus fermentum]|uniref:phage holin, LLH family n=1 Tax=Limosilactobacillus fermentum TaxID=1613 RepID=UPI0021BE4429|nr:phage holin, LLH family [Limosilactobacillus fermentum]
MKVANDIIEWLIQSGAIVWLFYFGFVIAKPWVDSKIEHAKTVQQREAWTLLEQVAMTTVSSLVSSSKPGPQKFAEASDQVQSYMADHGVHIDMKTVQSAVQAAYEQSPLTPTTEPTKKPDELGQKEPDLVPDGKAKAIDPKEVE